MKVPSPKMSTKSVVSQCISLRFLFYLLSLSKCKDCFPPKSNYLFLVTVSSILQCYKKQRYRAEERKQQKRVGKKEGKKMKGTSKLVMGATMVMLVCLAIVLALVLVLLAELYCSILLRKRRRLGNNTTTTTTDTPPNVTTTPTTSTATLQSLQNLSGPLSSYYAQGVLQAPRNLLFPAITSEEEDKEGVCKQQELPKLQPEPRTHQYCISILSTSSPPSPFLSRLPPQPIQGVTVESDTSNSSPKHLVYISNPMFDGEAQRSSSSGTPFETPDTSPSRLEMSGSSGDDEKPSASSPITPQLSPMKKLPSEACSVSLRDARSLGTSGSGSESHNGLSSSSSGSPRTSPSW